MNVVGQLQEDAWVTDSGENRTSHTVVGHVELLAAPGSNGRCDHDAEAHGAVAATMDADTVDCPFCNPSPTTPRDWSGNQMSKAKWALLCKSDTLTDIRVAASKKENVPSDEVDAFRQQLTDIDVVFFYGDRKETTVPLLDLICWAWTMRPHRAGGDQ